MNGSINYFPNDNDQSSSQWGNTTDAPVETALERCTESDVVIFPYPPLDYKADDENPSGFASALRNNFRVMYVVVVGKMDVSDMHVGDNSLITKLTTHWTQIKTYEIPEWVQDRSRPCKGVAKKQ